MSKRKLVVILLCLVFLAPAFSKAGDGEINYYEPMVDDEEYGALLKHIFDGKPAGEAYVLYDELETHMILSDYEDWIKDAALARASLIVARYAKESGDKDTAEYYMEIADGRIKDARNNGAPESAAGVVEALSTSFWYLVDGSLSKAMKFPGMVDDLYEKHPEDFHVLLLAADRYLQSPGIVGGNKKKGLALFQEAERIIDRNPTAIWDKFSIYSGLALGYDSQKDEENAKKYATLAKEIYDADPTVNKLYAKYVE